MKKLRFTAIVALLVIVLANADFGQFEQLAGGGGSVANTRDEAKVGLSEKRIQHILYGDARAAGIGTARTNPAKANSRQAGAMRKSLKLLNKSPRTTTRIGPCRITATRSQIQKSKT